MNEMISRFCCMGAAVCLIYMVYEAVQFIKREIKIRADVKRENQRGQKSRENMEWYIRTRTMDNRSDIIRIWKQINF